MTAALVTFAGSTLGTALCRALSERMEVVAAGPGPAEAVPLVLRRGRVRYVQADLARSRTRRELLFGPALEARCEVVVHGRAPDGRRLHADADAVRELLHLCERHPTLRAFVYRSSGEVYRVRARDPTVIDEAHPLESGAQMPAWQGELVEADLAACAQPASPGLRVAVLRLAELFGAGEPGELQRWLRAGPCLRPFGFDPVVNVLGVDDAVRALVLAVEARAQGVFNVPGADTLPLSELAARCGRACLPVPGCLLPAVYGLRGGFSYAASARRFHFGGVLCGERAREALGYVPQAGILWEAQPWPRLPLPA